MAEKMLNSFDIQDSIADDDIVLGYDKSENKVKNFKFGTGIWNWIVDKLATAVVSKLTTTDKTIIGALNELNGNRTVSIVLEGSSDAVGIIKNNWDSLPQNVPLNLYLRTSTVNCTANGYRYGEYGMFEIISIGHSMSGWLLRYQDEYTFYANSMIKNSKTLYEPVLLKKSQKVSLKCLNCLVLIISNNGGYYDLYACIGYQSDSNRSLVKLIAGNGINKIDYSAEDTEESLYGYYTITNDNTVNDAYIYRLCLTSLE